MLGVTGDLMAIDYTYESDNRIVRTEARGIISARDICNYVSEIIGRVDIASGFIEIVDIEKVEDFQFKYSDTDALRSLWPKFVKKGCLYSIIHAPTDLSYGLMRMLKTVLLMGDDTQGPGFEVVRTREEVIAGIKKARTQQGASADADKPRR